MRRLQSKELKDYAALDNICKLDEGYKIFRTLRGSQPYWEDAKMDIFAMIRQLGLPTFFLGMSAAETGWPCLLHTLCKIVDKKDYTPEQSKDYSWFCLKQDDAFGSDTRTGLQSGIPAMRISTNPRFILDWMYTNTGCQQ